jgi:flagellar protein FliO/FliZ
MTAYLLETLAILALVCLLGAVVVVGGRRLGIGRARGPVTLAGHLPLDARRAIYLVRVGGQVLVVGASEAGLTKLGEVAASEVPEPVPAPTSSFARIFGAKAGGLKGWSRE